MSFIFRRILWNLYLLFLIQNIVQLLSKSTKINLGIQGFLPPAYVVRWEGHVLTRICPSICLSTGRGVPISHNALQHFPECHGQTPGGVPCQVQPGGYPVRSSWGVPCWGVPWSGTPPRSGWGGTQVGQQKEYSIHCGRYASCVHAGGLSCL